MTKRHSFCQALQLGVTALTVALISQIRAQEHSAPGDIVGIEQMIRAAGSLRNFKPKDEFDSPPTVNTMTGNRFAIELAVTKEGCDGYPSWSYLPNSSELLVSFSGAKIVSTSTYPAFLKLFDRAPGSYSTGHDLKYISLNCVNSDQGSYIAGNAFGALTEVFKSKNVVLAISPTGIDESMYGKRSKFESFWKARIPGDEARALSSSLTVRITGTIGQWGNGANVVCSVDGLRANMFHPFESAFDACIYKADEFRVELVDSRTGSAIFETVNQLVN